MTGDAHPSLRETVLARALAFPRPWIPLAIGLLIVLAVGVMTTRTVLTAQSYNRQVRETLLTLSTADAVMLSLMEMNSAQRGLIISRDRTFAERYLTAKEDFQTNLAEFMSLAQAGGIDPATEKRVEDALERRTASFNEIGRLISLNDYEMAARVSVGARQDTDLVREALARVKDRANASLERRQAIASENGENALLLTMAGLTIASLLILASILVLTRRSAELARANAEVRELASHLEARVAARTADLAEANEEIQRFAYIVSHDLRSPLVNVMGFTAELEDAQGMIGEYVEQAEAAQPGSVPAQIKTAVLGDMPEAINFIRTSTSRMDRLIKAILQISREGRRSLVSERIDLNTMFAELRETLAGQLDATGSRLDIAPLPTVRSDRLALEQVFANLLDNAIKYLRPGVPGRIEVYADVRAANAFVRIRDNGRGVSPADQTRIFELFRRAGAQDQPGEGIGLAHVQALVRRLGGQISIESTLGEGSTFTVRLPVAMKPDKD